MSYRGDIALGATIDIKFTTAVAGAPTTLAGSPVISAYVDNGTTEITAGITLTVDFDSRTGLNNVRVVATSGNGFAAATNVDLVITTGTVGGFSAAGSVVASFSINARNVATLGAGAIAAASFGVGAIDATVLATDAAQEIADAYLDRANAIETGLTPRQLQRLEAAALAGKASGLETTTAVYRNAVADSKARITATVDQYGNRTAVTTDVT